MEGLVNFITVNLVWIVIIIGIYVVIIIVYIFLPNETDDGWDVFDEITFEGWNNFANFKDARKFFNNEDEDD